MGRSCDRRQPMTRRDRIRPGPPPPRAFDRTETAQNKDRPRILLKRLLHFIFQAATRGEPKWVVWNSVTQRGGDSLTALQIHIFFVSAPYLEKVESTPPRERGTSGELGWFTEQRGFGKQNSFWNHAQSKSLSWLLRCFAASRNVFMRLRMIFSLPPRTAAVAGPG
jgi:hypothetical protein